MSNIDYKQFLELPDWKKMRLIDKKEQFRKFPIQTKEQESRRKIAILKICAHFTMQSFNDFIMNNDTSYFNLYALWPKAVDLFITPKLLDVVPINMFTYYGNCYCCENFNGCNKMCFGLVQKSNVVPIYGICAELVMDRGLTPNFYRVTPDKVCTVWNPLPFYEQILDYNIKKLFAENKTNGYEYKDYKMDMKNISFWKYFAGFYDIYDM